MAAQILDVSDWSLVQVDGYWRYVCHKQRLATSGYWRRDVTIQNRNGYRDDAGTRAIMAKRYAESFPFPPLAADDVPETRLGAPSDPKSWHIGCMVTQRRAIMTARALFPEEISDGSNCRAEIGREGLACRVCEERNKAWTARVKQVRGAMLEAFQ